MAQLATPVFNLIASTSDFTRFVIYTVANGSEYVIYRAELPDFSDQVAVYDSLVELPPGFDDYFEDVDITPGETYYYRAMAKANAGYDDSDYSPTITVDVPEANPLATPTLTNIATDKFFTRWSIGAVANAAQYRIERSGNPSFINPDWFLITDLNWEDYGLMPGSDYWYRVRAIPYPESSYTNSDWSTVQEVTTLEYPPLAKPGLSTSNVTENSVDLTITPVTGAITYNIYRSTYPGFDVFVSVYNGQDLFYVDTPLTDNTTYYYRVIANQTVDNAASPYSDVEEITTPESIIPDPSDDPIPGLKYYMGFSDINGSEWDVRFYFKDYSGGVTAITGGAEPLLITYKGFDKDIYEASIMDAKHSINVLNPSFSDDFYDDITSVKDKDVWVRMERGSDGFIFSGWLIGDQFNRTFDRTIYEISLTVASPFSVMKNTDFIQSDGRMYFGSQRVGDIIERCISSSIHTSLAPKYEVLSDLREIDYSGNLDLFKQIRVFIESFNDENGRPPKCYDLIEKIATSFGMFTIWENDTLKFIDNYYTTRPQHNIKIKEVGDNTDFLISNSENINKEQASKEVSVILEYGQSTGLLKDGFFMDYSSGIFNSWNYQDILNTDNTVRKAINPTTVTRVGTGRKVDPYRVRMKGFINQSESIFSQENKRNQGLYAMCEVKAGDDLEIDVRFKYFDWRAVYPTAGLNAAPFLSMALAIIPKNAAPTANNSYAFFYAVDVDETVVAQNQQFSYGEHLWSKWNSANYGDNDFGIPPIWIGMASNNTIQSFNKELGTSPIDGYLVVMFFGMKQNLAPQITNPSHQYVDILSAIVSKVVLDKSKGTKVTGEEIYLTQSLESGKIDEGKEVKIANYSNPDISGAILKSDNTASRYLARGGTGDLMQNWLVRQYMAQKRTQRYKADFEFKSSTIKASDLINLTFVGGALLPNKYAIGSLDYMAKSAESRVSVVEVDTEDREYKYGGNPDDGNFILEPDADFDMLENYKTYN